MLPLGQFDPKFQVKGLPQQPFSSHKTRLNDISYGIKIWTELSSVLSQFTRLADRRTIDRQLSRSPRWHSMQRGKNHIRYCCLYQNRLCRMPTTCSWRTTIGGTSTRSRRSRVKYERYQCTIASQYLWSSTRTLTAYTLLVTKSDIFVFRRNHLTAESTKSFTHLREVRFQGTFYALYRTCHP